MAMIKIWYIKNEISKEQIKMLLKTNGYLTFFLHNKQSGEERPWCQYRRLIIQEHGLHTYKSCGLPLAAVAPQSRSGNRKQCVNELSHVLLFLCRGRVEGIKTRKSVQQPHCRRFPLSSLELGYMTDYRSSEGDKSKQLVCPAFLPGDSREGKGL